MSLVALALASCVAKDPENLGELETSGGSESATDPTAGTESSSVSATTVEPSTTNEPSTTVSPTTDTESDTTRGETESESVSETQSETESATAESTGESIQCEGDPEVLHYPAGCPEAQSGVQLPTEGCYEECTGIDDECNLGRCTLMQVDPCPCAENPDLCCDSCSGEQWLCIDAADLGDCGLVVGRTFTSVEELECGLGPNGPELCNWSVAFALDGTFMWMHSDVGEGGTYACAVGAVVTITDGPQVDVDYDVDADILTWDGVQYQ